MFVRVVVTAVRWRIMLVNVAVTAFVRVRRDPLRLRRDQVVTRLGTTFVSDVSQRPVQCANQPASDQKAGERNDAGGSLVFHRPMFYTVVCRRAISTTRIVANFIPGPLRTAESAGFLAVMLADRQEELSQIAAATRLLVRIKANNRREACAVSELAFPARQ